uniref:Uncharacterized protein n=1 Tax=Parascaris univalens TaxID=6257 RepID=A0A915APR9_PARUN
MSTGTIYMISARIELATSCALGRRDNRYT